MPGGLCVPRAGAGVLGIILAGACGRSTPAADTPDIRVRRDSLVGVVVEIQGFPPAVIRALGELPAGDPAWTRLFRVVVDGPVDSVPGSGAGGARSDLPSVLGRYEVQEGRLLFLPRFPLAPGVRYRVELEVNDLVTGAGWTPPIASPLIHRFTVPKPAERRTTRVVAVHPSAPVLPSNFLRLTIEFSAPMEGGPAADYVRVLDDAGRPVPAVFLDLSEELWDAERRKVTLLIDPGRIKRGIQSNLEMGAPFLAGRRYQIVVHSAWRDATGAPLEADHRRDILMGAFDSIRPDPAGWQLSSPLAGTRDVLRVDFGEPLDHALARRMVAVTEISGATVPGRATLEKHDQVWHFVPASPWPMASVVLRVDVGLEDLAGNSVSRVFDSDRLAGGLSVEAAARTGPVRLVPVRIRQPPAS